MNFLDSEINQVGRGRLRMQIMQYKFLQLLVNQMNYFLSELESGCQQSHLRESGEHTQAQGSPSSLGSRAGGRE